MRDPLNLHKGSSFVPLWRKLQRRKQMQPIQNEQHKCSDSCWPEPLKTDGLSGFRCLFEAVADVRLGQQIFRVRRVILELPPQLA